MLLFLAPLRAVNAQDAPQEKPQAASDYTSNLQNDSTLASVLKEFRGQFISLADARELALKNSVEVHQAEALLKSAQGSVRRERGGFDPTVFAELSRTGTQTPTSSPFAGADALDEQVTNMQLGANMRLRFGTEIEFSITSYRTTSNSGFVGLNPEFSASGRLDITQPLLAGSWFAAKAPVTAAERVEDAIKARYQDAILGVIQAIDNTYWDLYAAERDLAVLQLTVDQAEAFLNETKIRARSGLIGPADVANATVFYSQQRQAELNGHENLDRASNQLATLIGQRPSGENQRFRPLDTPQRPMPPAASTDSLVAEAIAGNYVVKAAQLELEAAQELTRGAGWNVLPALDLIGSLGGNGLAGTGQEVVFGNDTLTTTFEGPNSQAFSQVFSRDYPTWSVGLRLTIPIGMREARGERDRLKAQEMSAEQNLIAAKRAIEEQVRNAYLEFQHAEKRLAAAEEGVQAARTLVRIGNIEFRANRLSAFEIVRLNADLAAAQLSYSQALVRSAKASSALRRLTGEGLDTSTELR